MKTIGRKSHPRGVTKENRTEQEGKSMNKRSEMKIGPTRVKHPSQQENSGKSQNGQGGGNVDFGPCCKTQRPVQACLVIDVPHPIQTGDKGDQDTQHILANTFWGNEMAALAFAKAMICSMESRRSTEIKSSSNGGTAHGGTKQIDPPKKKSRTSKSTQASNAGSSAARL